MVVNKRHLSLFPNLCIILLSDPYPKLNSMRRILLLLACWLPLILTAQNLVLNPGFETLKPNSSIKPCQYVRAGKAFTNAVQDWSAFNNYTPDIVIWHDSLRNCPYPQPHGGHNMAGIIAYHPNADSGYEHDYHELIQGKSTRMALCSSAGQRGVAKPARCMPRWPPFSPRSASSSPSRTRSNTNWKA